MGNRSWFTICKSKEELHSLIDTILEWEKTTGVAYVIRIEKECPAFEIGDLVVAWGDNGIFDLHDFLRIPGERGPPTSESEAREIKSRMMELMYSPSSLSFPGFEPFIQNTLYLDTLLLENPEWHTEPGGPKKFGRMLSPEEVDEL